MAKAEKGTVKSAFVLVHTLIIIWLTGKILKTVSPILLLRWSSNVLYYLGILPLGPAYFLFSRAIIGKKDSRRFKAFLFIPSFVFCIVLITNPLHYLFYSHYNFETDSFGPLFYAHLVITYIFIILSVATLFYAASINKRKKMKALSLAAGAMLPLFINLYYIFVSVSPMFDTTPIYYNASLIILGISAFYHDFFNFIPKAVSSALNSLPGIICIGHKSYGIEKDKICDDFKQSVYSIQINKKEISIRRCINIDPIIEGTRKLQSNLAEMNKRHCEIKREIKRKVESLQYQERLRLAGEVHDILGYSISSIICLIESCRFNKSVDDEYNSKIQNALEITSSGISELHHFFSKESEASWKSKFFQLISKIEIYGLKSELIISETGNLNEENYRIFYKILKESLTNCLKHGEADKIIIAAHQSGDKILFHIIDNGAGCRHIYMGTGLLNMKRRIEKISGEINFFSELGSGFQITIILPLESVGESALPIESTNDLIKV